MMATTTISSINVNADGPFVPNPLFFTEPPAFLIPYSTGNGQLLANDVPSFLWSTMVDMLATYAEGMVTVRPRIACNAQRVCNICTDLRQRT
jgi:hypothetical protein